MTITMTRGHDTAERGFDPLPSVNLHAGGFPVAPLGVATMGGFLVVSATLVAQSLKCLGLPLILVGATVVTADGFSGVVTPVLSPGAWLDTV
jgi:hypothetical protein